MIHPTHILFPPDIEVKVGKFLQLDRDHRSQQDLLFWPSDLPRAYPNFQTSSKAMRAFWGDQQWSLCVASFVKAHRLLHLKPWLLTRAAVKWSRERNRHSTTAMEDTEHAEQEREGQPRFPLALSQRITPSDGKERILPQKRSPQCAPLMWCFFWMAPEGANCPLISTVSIWPWWTAVGLCSGHSDVELLGLCQWHGLRMT